MARPALTPINNGNQGWDSDLDDNFEMLTVTPIPLPESALTSLASLQSTYPAAAYDRCLIWINLTTYGYTLCWSNGTSWVTLGFEKRPLRSSAATISQLITDKVVRFTGTTNTYNLLAAASWAGITVDGRNDGSGNLTIDPSGAETINGAATLVVAAGAAFRIYSDGTAVYSL